MLGRILHEAGNGTAAQAALLLARRLTPGTRGPTPSTRITTAATTSRVGGRGRPRAVLLMAVSGSYNKYVAPLIRSAQRYFLRGAVSELRFVVFTDTAAEMAHRYPPPRLPRVTWVARPAELGWPLAAMLRSRHYVDAWHLVSLPPPMSDADHRGRCETVAAEASRICFRA
jgi:hypothetical protein